MLAGAGLIIGMSLHSTPVASAHAKTTPTVRPTPKADPKPSITPTPAASVPAGGGVDPGVPGDRSAAVAWVAQQVAAGTVVACDVPTCAALTAAGFPPAQEVQVDMASQSLSNATLVVVTPPLRTLFTAMDPALGSYVAPEIMASFGQVTVQVIDPNGAADYEARLAQDVQDRIQLGQQLLNSGRVSASATAQGQLAAGDVDSRVLLALQALATQQPIDVVDFGDSGPGAGPGIPFRTVDLAESDAAAGMAPSAYLQSMIRLLRAHANFPAFTKASQATLPTGQTVVEVEYPAPSPLGLLAPS